MLLNCKRLTKNMDFNITEKNYRIQNPYKLISQQKALEFEKKISQAMSCLAQKPENGGNPFLFVSAVGKYHIITENLKFPTAATDGRYFYWHPNYLENLNIFELAIVLEHEVSHVVCDHCRPSRINGRNSYIWNIAADYVVNTNIEYSWRSRKGHVITEFSPFEHPLWKGNLSIPLSLENFKGLIDESCEIFEKGSRLRFVDITLYGKNVEFIYYEIMDHIKKSNKSLYDLLNMPWEFDFDDHMGPALTRSELIDQILRAAASTKLLAGKVPGYAEESLAELVDPQTTWQDYIIQTLQKSNQQLGRLKDFNRYRKRFISSNYYFPKHRDNNPRFVALLDTSGSMTDSDIAFGASELKVLGLRAEGVVVPVDAAVHWEAATKIKNIQDVSKIKVVGRGGTVFDDFFRNFKSKLHKYGPFNLAIIITDGAFGIIPPELNPKIPVIWVLTEEYENFQVPFGKVLQLRNPNREPRYVPVQIKPPCNNDDDHDEHDKHDEHDELDKESEPEVELKETGT